MARLLLLFVLLPVSLSAQSITGNIVGTVTDATGAVVPGARVTVTNEGTGIAVSATTNDRGDYVAPNLVSAMYTVRVEFEGFRTMEYRNIELLLNATVRRDVQLQTGKLEQSVTVTAEQPVINSDTSSISSVVDERMAMVLPLDGRTLDQLVVITAGNTSDNVSNPKLGGSLHWGGNVYSMDGTAYNDLGNGGAAYSYATKLTTMPSVDTVKEVKVETNNAKAEHGGSAAIAMIAKSGTNLYHGTVFEFDRNRALTAKNFFTTGQPKPNYNRNEFGFTLGGPIRKNKTFFFASFEGSRQRTARTVSTNVATAAQRSGAMGATRVNDPLAGGTQFPGNQIPTERLDPRSQKLLSFVPLPNMTTGAYNYVINVPNILDTNRTSLKIDHQLKPRHALTASLNYSKGDPYFFARGYPPTYGNWQSAGYATKNASLGHKVTWLRSVNDFRYSYFSHSSIRKGQNADFNPATIFPGLYGPLPVGGVPTVTITSYATIGDYGGSELSPQISNQFTDNFTFIRGAHTLKAGADIAFGRVSTPPSSGIGASGEAPLGRFEFVNSRYSNNALGDFLLGYPIRTSRQMPTQVNLIYGTRYGLYFQDDWKVSRRLTLNLGVRYTLATTFQERDGSWSNFDFATGRFVVRTEDGKLPKLAIRRMLDAYPYVTSEQAGWGSSMMLTDWNNVGPRVGFAYMPFGNAKTVVRGGFGIAHNIIPLYIGLRQLSLTNSPFAMQETFEATAGNVPSLTLANPFPGSGAVSANPVVNAVERNLRNTYAQQWNLTIERQLIANLGLRLTYLGNKAVRVPWYNYNRNLPVTQASGTVQSRRPYQPWADILTTMTNGNSVTHQGQAEVIRRFPKGLSVQANYTWSKTIDNAKLSASPQNTYNAAADRGNGDSLRRHVFNGAVTYQLPFGTGHRLLNFKGPAGKLVSGWNVASLTYLRSGLPFSVTYTPSLTGWSNERADVVPGEAFYPEERTIQQWIRLAAFKAPAQFTYGNSARNLLFGPGSMKFDVSLLKDTKITERVSVQFRAESFNLPNHPSFGNPAASVNTTSTFGRISATSIENRAVQFGMKLLF